MPMKNPLDPGLSVRYDCLDPLDLKNVKHGPGFVHGGWGGGIGFNLAKGERQKLLLLKMRFGANTL